MKANTTIVALGKASHKKIDFFRALPEKGEGEGLAEFFDPFVSCNLCEGEHCLHCIDQPLFLQERCGKHPRMTSVTENVHISVAGTLFV